MSEIAEETWERLHAYHDGELRGLARWRFERRLQREPALRRELDELGRLGALLRAGDAEAAAPNLWDRIALRLPAVDARREAADEAAPAGAGWLRPAGAAALAAALTLALWLGVPQAPAPAGGAVRWVDSGGRPMLMLDRAEESGVTIIWMLDDAVEGAARGVRGEVA